MAEKEPVKVEVVSGLSVEQPTSEEKKVYKAQREQLFGKTNSHAPSKPKTLDGSVGAPAAQGFNLSKEEAEFAAAVAANKNAEDLPEEKVPAPVQASSKPIVEAGKKPKQ